MAQRGKVVDAATQRLIVRLRQDGASVRQTARETKTSVNTVRKYGLKFDTGRG